MTECDKIHLLCDPEVNLRFLIYCLSIYCLNKHYTFSPGIFIYAGFRRKKTKYLLVYTEITLGQMFPKKYPVGVPDGRGCVLEIPVSPEHTCVQQICLIFPDMYMYILTLGLMSGCGGTCGANKS